MEKVMFVNVSQHWPQEGAKYASPPSSPFVVQYPIQQGFQAVNFEAGFPLQQGFQAPCPMQLVPVCFCDVYGLPVHLNHVMAAPSMVQQNPNPLSSPRLPVINPGFHAHLSTVSNSSSMISFDSTSSLSHESNASLQSPQEQSMFSFQDPALRTEESIQQNQEECEREGHRFNVLVHMCQDLQNSGRLNRQEEEALVLFLLKADEHRNYWMRQGTELFSTFIDLVLEMGDCILQDSKKRKRQIVNLCNKFMKSFEFLKQESFDTHGHPFFEASRAYVILLKLMKMKQMFNFEGKFELTEERLVDPLRGRNVVRFRDKRLAVYSKESYEFLEFFYNLIKDGDVDVKSMYSCRDHKTVTKKNEEGKKERTRSIQGLLLYIVFTDDVNAEKFLKSCVKKCGEVPHFEQMYRKEASRRENVTLTLNGKWTETEFKTQQEMYHFGLALVNGEFKSNKPEAHFMDHNNRLSGS